MVPLEYLDDMIYEGWIDSMFTFMYKGVLVIMRSYIRDNEKCL